MMRLDHIRLDVADIERATRFYERALGLALVVRYETPTAVIVQMGGGGRPPGVELWQERDGAVVPHPTHHVAFQVDDLISEVNGIIRLGYPLTVPPYRIGHETVAFLRDPDGHLIELNDFTGRPAGGVTRG